MTTGLLLRAFQHVDSQFPSGGFAFSQGLEAASQLQDLLGPFDPETSVTVQINNRWAGADRVALVRAYRCGGDLSTLAEVDAEVEASTCNDLLRAGSRRNGIGLLTSHARIGRPEASRYREMIRSSLAFGHLTVVQGLIWRSLGIDESTAILMSGYQAATSLTTAAIRLGLVGAIEAQVVLERSLDRVAALADDPVATGQPLQSFIPLSEIAVAMHGTSGQRLFSN
ncbi:MULTISPECIES: urease accessory protein UreF [unclassified Hyphomicrobium]|uniref:urease accessory protein UreF n=1 Tax=unclassified Hyphomicrobium TaxID=2619925 RepID=UPI000213E6D4|nr:MULTISPECIES: urease accessory UreF family protein [unclassified Hyphomicrobium]CCB67148.1 putative urease accessory protein UreF [Hyphomicrobium sp. MC1]